MPKSKDDTLRRFQNEGAARAHAIALLTEHFDLTEEVRASGPPDVSNYVFDAVTICPFSGYILAWEFKRSHLFKSEFANVLRQAIYYRMATIQDPRFPSEMRRRPDACIVFPSWDGLHDDGTLLYDLEASGMRLLASHFRVGVLVEVPKYAGISIAMGESAIWHSWAGWTQNAHGILLGKRPLASRRALD
ncbi:MAG TPA: hypothetical protein VIT45_01960 [Allosphingosinicella sp.]